MKKNKPIPWMWSYFRHYLIPIIVISVLNALIAMSYIVLALISSYIIDVATNVKQGDLVYGFVLLGSVIFLLLIFNAVSSRLSTVVSCRLDINFKRTLFQKFIDKKYSAISGIHSGESLNLFTSDVDTVIGMITFIPKVVSIFTKIISGIVVLISFDKIFAVAILVIGVVTAIGARIYGSVFKKLHKQCQSSNGVVRGFLQECIESIVVIKTFSTKIPVIKKLNDFLGINYKLKLKRNDVSIIASSCTFLAFTCGYYLALAWGVFQVADGLMTFGTLTAFLQIVSQIRAPFSDMSGLLPQYFSSVASAERLIDFCNLEDDEIDINFDKNETINTFNAITCKNLSFGYTTDTPIIENFSFSIEKGDIISIVGESGAGKSTFFKVLLGLYMKTSGDFYVDCKDKQIDIGASTRVLFSYVPQGNLIFSGTIRDNIGFINPNIDDKIIEDAAKAADIYDFIDSLPNRFDTDLGERGLGLSEGQIQRIAIARALVSDAPVLLLDECTSALDEKTEQNVLSNIKNMKTKTVIFISHKPAALDICNKIIKLEDHRFTMQ